MVSIIQPYLAESTFMDPEFSAALQAASSHAPPPPGPMTIEQLRAGFDMMVRDSSNAYHFECLPPGKPAMSASNTLKLTFSFPDSSYTVQDKAVSCDGAEIIVRCITPVTENAQETFPLFFSIHGGGMGLFHCRMGTYNGSDFFSLRRMCRLYRA